MWTSNGNMAEGAEERESYPAGTAGWTEKGME